VTEQNANGEVQAFRSYRIVYVVEGDLIAARRVDRVQA
jgi:hypothetical protein